jgi:hypothetical protein
MASDDKKTKAGPTPKNEPAVKNEAASNKKDHGQPKNKSTSDADLSKAEGRAGPGNLHRTISGISA